MQEILVIVFAGIATLVGFVYAAFLGVTVKRVGERRAGRVEQGFNPFFQEVTVRYDLGVLVNSEDIALIQRSIADKIESPSLALVDLGHLLELYLLHLTRLPDAQADTKDFGLYSSRPWSMSNAERSLLPYCQIGNAQLPEY